MRDVPGHSATSRPSRVALAGCPLRSWDFHFFWDGERGGCAGGGDVVGFVDTGEEEKMKKSKGLRVWPFVVLWIVLGGIFLASLGLNCAAVAVLDGKAAWCGAEDECPALQEKGSFGTEGPKVVRIDLNATITREASGGLLEGGATDRVEKWLRQIRCATQDEEVEGLLVEVDSPGGGVTCSDELYHEICRFKEAQEGRAVVALVHDMAASGAYYAILGADRIVAQPTALVGSVGVLLNGVNAYGLAQKLGVEDVTLTSGANKDAMNPLKPVNPEQAALLQAEVDAMYERFLGLVAKHRHVSKGKLRAVCDGRVMGASAALEHRLVDQVGYREDALAALAKLLDAPSVRVVRYEEEKTLMDELLGVRWNAGGLLGRVSELLGAGPAAGRLEAKYAP